MDVILGNIQQRAEQAIAATEVLEPYQGVKQSAPPIGGSDGGELDGQHNGLQAVGSALGGIVCTASHYCSRRTIVVGLGNGHMASGTILMWRGGGPGGGGGTAGNGGGGPGGGEGGGSPGCGDVG